jgi:hypothetical protein
MMALKEFAHDPRGYRFMSDARDIAVPFSRRHEVWDWAYENRIVIQYQGTLNGTDVWRIQDDQHRAWFALRWS